MMTLAMSPYSPNNPTSSFNSLLTETKRIF